MSTMAATTVVSITAMESCTSVEAASSLKVATTTKPAAAGECVPPSVVAMVAVEPRSSANKDSAREPLRAIVAVRSASVRVIVVVTVRAHGRRPNVSRTYPDGDSELCRLRALL